MLTLPGPHGGRPLPQRSLRQEYSEFNRDMSTVWARIGGWVELPARLFVRGDLEYNTGDDLEGGRVNLGVGYRF